jgi:hypothetical protein
MCGNPTPDDLESRTRRPARNRLGRRADDRWNVLRGPGDSRACEC